MSKPSVRIVIGVVCALVVAGGLFGAALVWHGRQLYGLEPSISTNYALQANARTIAVPEDQAAWPLLIAWYENSFPADAPWNDLSFDSESPDAGALREHLSAGDLNLPELWKILERPHLGLVTCSINKPELSRLARIDSLESDSPFTILLLRPDIGIARKLARLLSFDARSAMAANDLDRVTLNLRGITRLSQYVNEHDSFIDVVVAAAMLELQAQTAIHLFEIASDPAEIAAIREALLASQQMQPRTEAALDAEEAMVLDYLQRVFTDDGQGDGRLTLAGLELVEDMERSLDSPQASESKGLDRLGLMLDGGSRQLAERLSTQYFELFREAAQGLLHERAGFDAGAFLLAIGEGGRDGDLSSRVLASFLPSSMMSVDMPTRAPMWIAYARLIGAIRLHELETGSLPESLDALKPASDDAVPIDLFTGEPLEYRRLNEQAFTLYSFGNDRDDDGGKHANDAMRPLRLRGDNTLHPDSTDGDWVLWPLP